MNIFTYHLIKLPIIQVFKNMIFPIKSNKLKGLIYAETMSAMILGSAFFSKPIMPIDFSSSLLIKK